MFDNLFTLAGPTLTAAMLFGGLMAVLGVCTAGSARAHRSK